MRRLLGILAVTVSLTSGQLLVPAGAGAEPSAPGAERSAPAAEPSASVGVVADLDTTGVREFWTPERIRAAVPLDQAGAAVTPRAQAARAGTVPRSTGKLFFVDGNKEYVCSASTVNTAERNLVITAGHCAYSTTECTLGLICSPGARHYYSNFLFVPAYDRKAAPYGEWVATHAITHSAWMADEDDGHDQAFLVMAPLNGRNIVDVVGGNGLAWNYPAREDGVRVVGWPAESPYDGQTMQECVGSTTPYPSSVDAQISCPLTGGASGGPWFLRMTSADVGFIWAVTSRRTLSGPPVLLAMPFDSTMESLLASARTAARPTTPAARAAAVQARPKKKRNRLVVAPTAGAVGYGEGYQLHASARPGRKVVLQIRVGKKWKRVVRFKMPATGAAVFDRVDAPGTHRFRLKARKGKAHGKPAAITVRPCPTPLDSSPAVVSATRCTSPVG